MADHRLPTEDLDELFGPVPEARAAIEALIAEGRGLLLAVSPAGGGGRPVTALLAARLGEGRSAAVKVTRSMPVAGNWRDVREARTDAAVARALHEAVESGADLVVIDDLPGPRAVERALLAASRVPVLAGFVATDVAAALSWTASQGLLGAVKAGLLRGVLDILALDASCARCSVERETGELEGPWSVPSSRVLANEGCSSCVTGGVVRTVPVMEWTPVASVAERARSAGDESAQRRQLRAEGIAGIVGRAVEACSPGVESGPWGRGDFGSAMRLLGMEP